jgi:hypothetical protein
VLGIDFGTSNSAAAYMDASGQLQEVPLGQGRAEMPTALFFDADTHAVLGRQVKNSTLAAGAKANHLAYLAYLGDATVGGGSTIPKNTPPGALSVARGKQVSMANWQRPSKHKG